MRLAFLALLVLTSAAHAEPLELQKLPTPLLGDRFFMQLPIGMRVVANPQDGSGLALPRWASTRAELDLDRPLGDLSWPAGSWRAKIVMVAWDTYATARDLLPDVRADLDRQGGVLAEASIRDLELPKRKPIAGPRAVAVDPPLPRRANHPNLIHAVYAVDRDEGVVVIAFYAFGNALDEVEAWAQIARMATATLEIGNTDLTGHLGTSFLRLDDHDLEIAAPTGWRIVVAHSKETGAAYVHALVRLGDGPASCAVDQNIASAPPNAQRANARLFDAPAIWRTWVVAKRWLAEAVVAVRGRPRVRIACEAPTAGELRELQKTLARARFKTRD